MLDSKTRGWGRRAGVMLAAGWLSAGCPADDGAGSGDSEGEDTTAGSTTDRDTGGMSGPSTMTAGGGTGSTTAPPPGLDSTGDSGMDSVGFITAGSDDGAPQPQPNGAQCAGAADCESGFCFEVPMLGGVCSECVMDSDCEMGTCSLDINLLYAVCTDGQQGVMCDSDEGCMGDLVCEPLIDTGGVFPLDFCSECGANAPCTGDQVCTPVYDQVAFQGYHGCVDPMSVPDGGGCPVAGGVGDGTVCTSGVCAIANVFMVVDIGVCGECADDTDCTAPATCQPTVVDMAGITPSACM